MESNLLFRLRVAGSATCAVLSIREADIPEIIAALELAERTKERGKCVPLRQDVPQEKPDAY